MSAPCTNGKITYIPWEGCYTRHEMAIAHCHVKVENSPSIKASIEIVGKRAYTFKKNKVLTNIY